MADIFVSYSRTDKARVAPLVAALEAEGWSVWWDPEIAPGQEFDSLIATELETAHAILVVWTPASVSSRWVRGEAREAADRGILVPVRFDDVKLPIDVRAIHTTDLDAWKENPQSAEFQQLVRALSPLAGRSGEKPGVAAPKVETLSAAHAAVRDRPRHVAVCVLPFANMSGDPEQEYFSDGISEDIITDLSKVSAIAITARNTAFSFKGKHVDVPQVARQLKVSHVLEGSVRKSGSRVRISAQLIDGATGNHVWAERYDRDFSEIFALQDEISRAIVSALKVKLLPEERSAIEARGTLNPEAYKLYLMARQYLFAASERHRPLIVRLCQRAIEIDSNYAPAWALLAIGQSNIRLLSGGTGENGWDAANRALALDPNLADAHAAKGRILADQGHYADAVSEHEIAVRLDPESYEVNCAAARCYTAMRRYDDAIRHYEKATMVNDHDIWACGMAIQCYQAKGDLEGTKRIARHTLERFERIIAAEPDHTTAMSFGVTALIALAEKERAMVWTERALLLAPPDDISLRYNLACEMAVLGDVDRALDLLEAAVGKLQRESLAWIKIDTTLDNIREHPRFKAMIAAAEAHLATAN
ncbi:MAG TPA: TIR domain-containing protein [Steroidobacteraceae bacterium]